MFLLGSTINLLLYLKTAVFSVGVYIFHSLFKNPKFSISSVITAVVCVSYTRMHALPTMPRLVNYDVNVRMHVILICWALLE